LQISNGTAVIASLPKVSDEYDLPTLADYMMSLKNDHPDTDAASVLLEPSIAYDYLIRVMDVVRSAAIPGAGEGDEFKQLALFTQISIGDAP
jgi:hypothetical protein